MSPAKKAPPPDPLADLRQRDFWTLPQFARAWLPHGKDWVYARLVPDATGREGVVRLPGLDVPVSRDTNGHWLVARHQYEVAKRRAAEVA